MRIACSLVVLMICGCLIAQAQSVFDVYGKLELVDLPPNATPVEAMLITLHPLGVGHVLPPQANPDRDGAFVLRRVTAGRYALELPFPGRIINFAKGSEKLAPDGFAVSSSDGDTLRIVVSLKTAEVSVEVLGVPSEPGKRVVVLAPADALLTLRESCFSNALREPRTKFRYISPGEYRAFVVDTESANDVAVYAPRFPKFLRDRAMPFKVSAEVETKATATYVDPDTIRQAVREIGPVR
jgi:hypothetical protein